MQIVRYSVGDGVVVLFEVEPVEEFDTASGGRVIGRVKEALGPAVEAAREVLDRVKSVAPQEVEVKFGIKVSGTMNWVVAKAATDANFEVTLRWQPGSGDRNAEETVP
ncbi:MAG TPA: CU044_2847 family protein [Candidatus Limnocylindrales bacterium]|nr:CU044_2847 family protein [Candidatus Limnocylindrales bacterium]